MARSRLLGRCLILGTVDRIDRYNIRDFRVLGEITRFLGSGGYFSRSDGLEEMVASRVPPPPPHRALHTRTHMHAEEERRGEARGNRPLRATITMFKSRPSVAVCAYS